MAWLRAPLAYNTNLGPGLGLWWQQNGWSVSAQYMAGNGADSAQGLFSSSSASISGPDQKQLPVLSQRRSSPS